MHDCVVGLSSPEVIGALATINDAIKRGYDVTRGVTKTGWDQCQNGSHL